MFCIYWYFFKIYLKTCPKNSVNTTNKPQNALIKIIGDYIRNKILDEIKASKFYAILADETTDKSGVEQFSLAIRYYRLSTSEMCEEFLDFVPVKSITGETLAEHILDKLKSWGLSTAHLRGQGYDGASNMSGAFKGVAARILEVQPLAFYTHCSAHCLNLVVVSSCEVGSIQHMFLLLKVLIR